MKARGLLRSVFSVCVVVCSYLIQVDIAIAVTPGGANWTQQLGTAEDDRGWGVAVDNAGNAYITGETGGDLDGYTSSGGSDIFLSKYDSSGTKQWTRQIGTVGDDRARGVMLDSNGNIYITGYAGGHLDGNTSSGSYDIFLTKYDSSGTKQWTRQFGTTNWDMAQGVALDNNSNIYITGHTFGSLDGNTYDGVFGDIFLTKYDSAGIKQWTRQMGSGGDDRSWGVAVDSSGSAYIAGETGGDLDGNTSTGDSDIFLSKYDSNGVKQWTRQLGTTSSDEAHGLALDSNGNIYITGGTGGDLDGSTNTGGWDIFLTKYDSNGVKQWTRQLGSQLGEIVVSDHAWDIAVNSNGDAYITGYTEGALDGNIDPSFGIWDIFLTKYDSNGNKQWTRQLGSMGNDYAYGVALDGSGNAYVAGQTQGDLDGNTSTGGWDIFLTQFDISDITAPTGTISIDNGAVGANTTSVILTLNCDDGTGSGCAQMQFNNNGSSWSGWEAYTTSKLWTLITGDGSKTVYVQYRDEAGNVSSNYSDTISLDTVAPAAPSISNPVDSTVSSITSIIVSGSAEIGSIVNVYDGVAALGAVSADGSGNWSLDSGVLTEGTHSLTARATDNAGNSSIASATVSYTVDTTAPVITLNGSNVTIEAGAPYTDLGAIANDVVDGGVTIMAVGTVNTLLPGTYILTYDHTDTAGNIATQVTRTVTVVDTTVPVITLNGSNVTIEAGAPYTDLGAIANDVVDGGVFITAVGTVNISVPGIYTLTYDYTDTAGNAAVSVTRTVTVVDTTAPSTGSGSSGGGCSLNSMADQDEFDPLLPLLLLTSTVYLWRRRRSSASIFQSRKS